jgi:hypothetical protein
VCSLLGYGKWDGFATVGAMDCVVYIGAARRVREKSREEEYSA